MCYSTSLDDALYTRTICRVLSCSGRHFHSMNSDVESDLKVKQTEKKFPKRYMTVEYHFYIYAKFITLTEND